MREVLSELLSWWRAGEPVGMATVVRTWRSAPRPAGATMLVGPDGTAVGSVSGGCVEGAVYELCQEAIQTGDSKQQRYGVSDDDAFAVGLTCGGIIELLVERVDQASFPELPDVAASIEARDPVAVVSLARSARPGWTTPPPTTRAGCSPRVVRTRCTTGSTASGAARDSRCSSRRTRHRLV